MAISYECPKCRNLVDADDYYSSCPMCGEVLSVFWGGPYCTACDT